MAKTHDAGASTHDTDLRVSIHHSGLFTTFTGTRAQIDADGLVPDGFAWPPGFLLRTWRDGYFGCLIRRHRSANKALRDPAIDLWTLKRTLICAKTYAPEAARRASDDAEFQIFMTQFTEQPSATQSSITPGASA